MILGMCMVAIMFVLLVFLFEFLSYSFCLSLHIHLIIAMENKRAPLLKDSLDLRSQALHGELLFHLLCALYIFTLIITLTDRHISTAMERKLAVDVQHVSVLFPRKLALLHCAFSDTQFHSVFYLALGEDQCNNPFECCEAVNCPGGCS